MYLPFSCILKLTPNCIFIHFKLSLISQSLPTLKPKSSYCDVGTLDEEDTKIRVLVFFTEDSNYLSKNLSHLKRLLFIRIKCLVFIMCTRIDTYPPAGVCLHHAFHQVGFNWTEFLPKFLFTQCLSSLATNTKVCEKIAQQHMQEYFYETVLKNSVILLIIYKVLNKLFHVLVIFLYTFLQKIKTVLHCKNRITNNLTSH